MEPNVSPPDGWRLLTRGEKIRCGDRFLAPVSKEWWPIVSTNGERWDPRRHQPMARQDALPEEDE